MCKTDDPDQDQETDNNNKKRQKTNSTTHHQVPNKQGHVSARGASNLALPMAYLKDMFAALDNPCHPQDNPTGHIPVAVAENKLVTDILQEKLATLSTAQAGFAASKDVYSYNSMLGLPTVRQAVADFLQDHFLLPPQSGETTTTKIDSNHIVIGAGVMSFLSSVFYALGNAKEAVLIPAPYYAAFDNDLRAYAGCIPIAVHSANIETGPTLEELEQAKQYAETELGLKVRFLLLTNPNNPLGVVYSQDSIQRWIDWARGYHMDSIVDEIYALSVFDPTTTQFTSVIKLLDNKLGTDVHVLWGLSKDFGSSGFRLGVLYTQNELLLEALGNLNGFAAVSHPMQRMMADMLSDKAFVKEFLETSRLCLKTSYDYCTSILSACNVPFTPAQAGMFVWLDLSGLLKTNDSNDDDSNNAWNEEERLSKVFVQRGRMVMTPGQSQHAPKPGMFRICYAYVSLEVLKIGMQRFQSIVKIIQAQGGLGDWVDEDTHWNDVSLA